MTSTNEAAVSDDDQQDKYTEFLCQQYQELYGEKYPVEDDWDKYSIQERAVIQARWYSLDWQHADGPFVDTIAATTGLSRTEVMLYWLAQLSARPQHMSIQLPMPRQPREPWQDGDDV